MPAKLPLLAFIFVAAALAVTAGCTTMPSGLDPAPTPTPTAQPTQPPPTATPTPFGSVFISLPDPTPTVLPRSDRLELFEDVWDTIDAGYVYTDFGGLNWRKVYAEYQPHAAAAVSAPDFYGVLMEMVAKLDDDHSAFYPPWQVNESYLIAYGPGGLEGLGIAGYPLDGELIVQYVFANSPAEHAGIARRDRITHVNGTPLSNPESPPVDPGAPEGTIVRLTISAPGQTPREVVLEQATVINYYYPASFRLDEDPGVAFLIIPTLGEDSMGRLVTRELSKQMQTEPPLTGLIIDLRGNSGGWIDVLTEILGHFVTGKIGEERGREGVYPVTVEKSDLYDGLANVPVVVLVDGGTVSAAEIMAGTLQARGRAKIVGTRSSGNTELVYSMDLDDGSQLWLARSTFTLSDGTNLEARGVVPDVPVEKASDLGLYEKAFLSFSIALLEHMQR